jgi:phospho-N-acetylmuramoyl-pentapeptide-transferase
MFEYLGTVLVDYDPGFDVLRYLTVRTLGGTVTCTHDLYINGPIYYKVIEIFAV